MYQTIEQTDDEKRALYMKRSKEELVTMLIECNKHLSNVKFNPLENKKVISGYIVCSYCNSVLSKHFTHLNPSS